LEFVHPDFDGLRARADRSDFDLFAFSRENEANFVQAVFHEFELGDVFKEFSKMGLDSKDVTLSFSED